MTTIELFAEAQRSHHIQMSRKTTKTNLLIKYNVKKNNKNKSVNQVIVQSLFSHLLQVVVSIRRSYHMAGKVHPI